MDGEEEKSTQNANVLRNMLPRASQREVPFDCLLACFSDNISARQMDRKFLVPACRWTLQLPAEAAAAGV